MSDDKDKEEDEDLIGPIGEELEDIDSKKGKTKYRRKK